MTIKPPNKWARHVRVRRNNPKKVLGRVKDESVEKIAEELSEKFGMDPESVREQIVTDWAIAREEGGSDDFVSVTYNGGHDLSGLTAPQKLDYVHTGVLPPPSAWGKK